MNSKLYKPSNPSVWSGRIDSETDYDQFRYHQIVKCTELKEMTDGNGNEVSILGFESDIGVERNGGRIGAVKGPDYFRKTIGSLCWHGDPGGFIDAGNIKPERDLEAAQHELGKAVFFLLEKKKRPFIIGGGHETAFGHFKGIADFLNKHDPEAKPGILNIDAHFDLRSYENGAHSGSSFLQAHDYALEKELDLKYFVYGINSDNNTRHLFNKANDLGAIYCTNQEIFQHEPEALQKLRNFLQSRTHIYLTVCLDVFLSAIAPGVSAPAWNGIMLSHAQQVFVIVKKSGMLMSMDVCELNPEYDEHGKTAWVAGTLFSELVR